MPYTYSYILWNCIWSRWSSLAWKSLLTPPWLHTAKTLHFAFAQFYMHAVHLQMYVSAMISEDKTLQASCPQPQPFPTYSETTCTSETTCWLHRASKHRLHAPVRLHAGVHRASKHTIGYNQEITRTTDTQHSAHNRHTHSYLLPVI